MKQRALAITATLLFAAGLLQSTACFTGAAAMNNQKPSTVATVADLVLFIGVPVGAVVTGLFAVTQPPCRQPATGEILSAEEWLAIADCQARQGHEEQANRARDWADFMQPGISRSEPRLCAGDRPLGFEGSAAWDRYADCLQLNARLEESNAARTRAFKLRQEGR